MKIIAVPIEVVAWFTEAGVPTPVRIKYIDNQIERIIKVDKVLFMEKEKLAGNHMILFKCKSLINDTEKIFELKMEISSCKWLLWKI